MGCFSSPLTSDTAADMTSHSVILAAVKYPETFSLTYSERPAGMKQARFQSRIALQPQIDLGDYTCRAVIDWVDIRFRTVNYTQRKWIKHYIDKAIGEKVFSEKKKPGDDGKYREFRVRIQEPVTRDLLLAEEAVRAKWGLQQPAESSASRSALISSHVARPTRHWRSCSACLCAATCPAGTS